MTLGAESCSDDERERFLSVKDAYDVIAILIMMQPGLRTESRRVHMQGAITDTVDTWPATDWRSVSTLLRDESADHIADMLDTVVVER